MEDMNETTDNYADKNESIQEDFDRYPVQKKQTQEGGADHMIDQFNDR